MEDCQGGERKRKLSPMGQLNSELHKMLPLVCPLQEFVKVTCSALRSFKEALLCVLLSLGAMVGVYNLGVVVVEHTPQCSCCTSSFASESSVLQSLCPEVLLSFVMCAVQSHLNSKQVYSGEKAAVTLCSMCKLEG